MSPNDNVDLFEAILDDLDKNGILQDFILIGSWALRVYKEHFNNDPMVPVVSTQDLDLLVTNPPKVSRKVDVSELLSKYDLTEVFSPRGDYSKFVGPDFEVEFLYPEKGRGEPRGKVIKELGIVATPLRYLNFIQDYSLLMTYRGHQVRVPEPAVFVLMKYLLVITRDEKHKDKIRKDLSTAGELEFFLLENDFQDDFIRYFNDMPGKWQKNLMGVLKENNSDLADLLETGSL